MLESFQTHQMHLQCLNSNKRQQLRQPFIQMIPPHSNKDFWSLNKRWLHWIHFMISSWKKTKTSKISTRRSKRKTSSFLNSSPRKILMTRQLSKQGHQQGVTSARSNLASTSHLTQMLAIKMLQILARFILSIKISS